MASEHSHDDCVQCLRKDLAQAKKRISELENGATKVETKERKCTFYCGKCRKFYEGWTERKIDQHSRAHIRKHV